MTASVQLPLRDGSYVELTAAAVSDAAEAVADVGADASETSIDVNNRWVSALSALAVAVKRPAEDLRPSLGFAALEELQFRLRWPAPDSVRNTETEPADGASVDEPAKAVQPDLTPELSRSLQRLHGKWVAIEGGALLYSGPTLRSILEHLGDRPATVLRVPELGVATEAAE